MYDYGYPQIYDATDRGWGRGWQAGDPVGTRPGSILGRVVPFSHGGVDFPGGLRIELAELAHLLLDESLDEGYIPRLDSPGCWGGAFRPTKRSDGSYTTTPSNHSWYTALDINAPHNVYGSSTHQIPQAMADLWKQYGWRWLGPPIKDWMHFDYAGSPANAARDLARAREDGIGMALTPAQKQVLADAEKFLAAVTNGLSADGPTAAGARVAKATKRVEAGSFGGPHTHVVTGTAN